MTREITAAWADHQRQQAVIKSVDESGTGYSIIRDDGWGLWLDKEHGVSASAGQIITVWGRGVGYPYRGLAVGDEVAFYRTEGEQERHQKVERYGADAADWLAKWDSGKGVWTIQMGGLSAGYDQRINLITAEILRALLKLKPDIGETITDDLREAVNAECADALECLGLSGAQYGAGFSLAVRLYKFGPISVLESAPDDRRIQASKSYPTLDRLIAAAPTLLEALTKCLSVMSDPIVGTIYGDDPNWYARLDDAIDAARQAISAATGQQETVK